MWHRKMIKQLKGNLLQPCVCYLLVHMDGNIIGPNGEKRTTVGSEMEVLRGENRRVLKLRVDFGMKTLYTGGEIG